MKKSMGNVVGELSRILGACILTVLFLITCDTTVKAYSSYVDETTNIEYAVNMNAKTQEERVATVYSYSGDATEITIPASVTTGEGITYKVIGIGDMDRLAIADTYPDFAEEIELAKGFYENTTITTVNYAAPENILFIGTTAFMDCSALTGETPLPSGLKYLGDGAFRNCDGLNAMHIPEGVLTIGDNTFYSCNSISENTIPTTITDIGSNAFQYCESLSGTFKIPSAITQIPDRMLYGCKSITAIEFHDNVEKIGIAAFSGCKSLTGTFTVPEKVTEIPSSMLSMDYSEKNQNLTKIELHDKITKIGSDAFACNAGITEMTIPAGVTRIESGTFNGCLGLEKIDGLGDNITDLGYRAFKSCNSLDGSIKVPDEMTEIPYELFYNCRQLDSIVLPAHIKGVGNEAFWYCESWEGDLSSLELSSVGKWAFAGCGLLSGLPSFSDEITQIPESAFYNCTSLSGELALPGNVKSIGTNAFSGCTGITGLSLEEGVETIGNQAFSRCEGLSHTTIYVPQSVTSVGTNAFLNHYQRGFSSGKYICNINIFCPQDKQFEEYNKAICVVSYKEEPGDMISLHVERRYLYYEIGETWIDELNIPEEIFGKTVCALTKVDDSDICESLGGYMTELEIIDEAHYFNDWDQIAVESHGRNCTICGNLFTQAHNHPNGTAACSECGHIPFTLTGSLSQKVMQTGYASGPICTVKAMCKLSGEKLTYQWYENNAAISGATALSYTVPTGKAAGTYTYTCKVSNGNFHATSVPLILTVYKPETIDGIKLIDPSLETPKKGDYFKSSDGKSIYKVSSVTTGKAEVEYCRPVSKKLASVTIPATVTIAGVKYNVTSIAKNAFKNCRKLKTLKIGKNVKKIGASAFYGCTSLTKVTGGKSLLTIGKSAFKGCKKLNTVSFTSKKLKTIGAKAFYGCKKLVKITLKTTKLTKKSVGKNALKGTNRKLVIKVPKKKVSAYKKFLKTKGNKKVTVKK